MTSGNDLPADGWTEDTIIDHPMWPEHYRFEQEMLGLGRQRYRRMVAAAEEHDQRTRLRPYRMLVQQLVLKLSGAITKWVEENKHRRGPKHVAFKFLRDGDAEGFALITIRTVMDRMSRGNGTNVPMLNTASAIGSQCENQMRAKKWMEVEPEGWSGTQKRLNQQGSTEIHRKRVNTFRFNKMIEEHGGWKSWTVEEKIRVGVMLLALLVENTKRFTVVADPLYKHERVKSKKGKRSGKLKKSAPYVLVPNAEMLEWLNKSMELDELLYPQCMPMLVPPKRWDGMRGGGYWTSAIVEHPLVKIKAQNTDQHKNAFEDMNALDMPLVYKAVNAMQEVPWRINERVALVARTMWYNGAADAGLPVREEVPMPTKPEDIATNEEARRAWKKKAVNVYSMNAKRVGRSLSTIRCLDIAARLEGKTFYFPQMLDFRGRMYPLPATLNPQGSDLARGLLMFAEGKPIGEDGLGWLAVHLANVWGFDKASFDERIDWVYERTELWERIEKDPMGNREWCDTDKPWQALAATLEWAQAMREGPAYVCSLPVVVDGTCNGIQHLSAMMRDAVAGEAVNLLPGDRPRDIYQEQADRLTARLRSISAGGGEEGALADEWLQFASPSLPRGIAKRPVMIIPYGGTIDAYNKYTTEWLKENDPDGKTITGDDVYKKVSWLCRHMWTVFGEGLHGPMEAMKWLRSCAALAATSGVPLFWKTPSGFVVRQFYSQKRGRTIDTHFDGRRVQLLALMDTTKMDTKAQARSVAPNFVHSMDAAALVVSIGISLDNGVSSMCSVHDAYGTLPSDMSKMAACLRAGFAQCYEDWDCMSVFRDACVDTALGEETKMKVPQVPAAGALDVSLVRESDYFFG